jgi:hypothetical protein
MAVQRKNTEPTIKDYATDIITIKGDIESIRRHMEEGKTEKIEDRKTLSDIKSTLVGSNMNGNKGIIFLLNDIDVRLKAVEKSDSDRRTTENNAKWVGGFIITAIFALIIWIVQHLPKAQ